MTLFTTDSTKTDFEVSIIRTGRVIYTSPDRDLAVSYVRDHLRDFDALEVREVVTTRTSRKAYRPRPVVTDRAPMCRADADLAIPVMA